MTSPGDPFSTGGDQELGRLLDRFQQDVAAIEGLSGRMAAVKGRGEAAQGRVVAEATQTGALCGLTIDPRAMRLGSAELAAAVLEAAGNAARAAEREAGDLVAPFLAGTVLDGEDGGTRRS
ncbi:YbaB/EbfC family nucleoid-associated protein [Nonomuraea sp. SBT364]|uniref:YbaB/EbfC family nucleoid-associated protein n=1 Tax=Nonomuraea sp. SBT364 TaxID=1580530 RepID=UPI00066DA86E|nr:YbaB/EbfC family nucleoid-associated protein [Nonomuraea sp. SBT364]